MSLGCVYIPDKTPSLEKKLEKIGEKSYNKKEVKHAHHAVKAGNPILDIKTLLSILDKDKSLRQFPDRSAKWFLENTQNLQGLLKIIAGNLVDYFDFDKVKIENTTFISDDLRQQMSDLVYLLPFREEANGSGIGGDDLYSCGTSIHSGSDDGVAGCCLICVRYGSDNVVCI